MPPTVLAMNQTFHLTRRSLLAGTTLAGAALALAPWRSVLASTTPVPPPLSLPAPTGPLRVGTVSMHLVDSGGVDPLAPTPRPRELMVRLWYPAGAAHQAAARYLPAGVAGVYTDFLNAATGASHPADLLTFPTHSRQDAPALLGVRRPVVLFSPGFGLNAALYTGLHEELASRGYIVVGVDHTFDASAVEFPDGRLETQLPGLLVDDLLHAVRARDMLFVLDQLCGDSRLPRGLGRMLDLSRVAAFGHSLGSSTVITAMDQDQRIDAGAALDGNPLGTSTLHQPFLMMGNQGHRRADDPDWADFYDRLLGPRRHLVIDGAEHADLSDVTVFKAAIATAALFEVGPIEGLRALTVQRTYLTAWLNQALLGRPSHLLRHESPAFPEVDFQP